MYKQLVFAALRYMPTVLKKICSELVFASRLDPYVNDEDVKYIVDSIKSAIVK